MSRWVGVLAVVLVIAACAPAGPVDTGDPIPSNPPGPKLTGRLLAFDQGPEAGEGRVVEVRDGATATVADGVIAADLSQDGRQLAYAREDGTLVRRDLASGAEATIPVNVLLSNDCLSWSPDGTRLAFLGRVDNALYVTTVDGVVTRVDQPKQERYVQSAEGYILPRADPAGGSVILFSVVACGRWLDDNRLVFDRVATMPGTVVVDEDEPTQQVLADTTTVAVLDPPRLVDSPGQWRLEDRCGDRVMTFVGGETSGDRYVVEPSAIGDDELGDAGWPAPGGGRLPSARAAFVDGSCDVLLLSGAAGEWHTTSRYVVDTGRTEKLRPTFDDDHNPPLLEPDSVAFNPEGTAWAVADGGALFVFDLETGGSTFASGTGKVSKVLGWLPS
ncbi:PD40 domain-containing protein [Actinophytocola oryzae]|uniref:WD40 repeat protein n=1 Tax=Actinophytocola oryzae TaxID=502181 RepID=A0A4V3FV54_9PSEU|nr:PD40 domain-containing protein [Actinophytocola oryzae]TDV57791.1 WD40 repeat protein [Actinophytocola oryzae]